MHLTLRARLALWIATLLAVCCVLLTLFINLGTTISTSSATIVTRCSPAVPAQGPVLSRCISQSQAPLRPWTDERTRIVYVLQHVETASLISLLVVLFLGGIGTYWLAGRALRQVRQVSRAAQEIDVDTLDRRLAVTGPDDELKRLGDSFDAMLDRLQQGVARERRFAADASHELRTPLAIMRTNLEVISSDPDATTDDFRAMAAAVNRSLSRLEHLTDDLLALTRTGMPHAIAPLALKPLVHDVVHDLAPMAIAQTVTLAIDTPLDVSVPGDEVLLRRAISNVVENAIRYNRAGGTVSISLSSAPGTATLTVRDTGIGIPQEAQSHVFERFYRVDQGRDRRHGGAGLGLALAHEIVCSHGGTISLESAPGVGTTLAITLPLSSASTSGG